MTEDLRYPVGKFAMPASSSADEIAKSCHILALLPAKIRQAVADLNDSQLDTPYRPGGWTVRQTVHHIADSHMNAYCRFRLALTEDAPTIKPYLEERWAELADARSMPIAPSLEIIEGVHTRLLGLIDAMTPDDWQRGFVHPEHGRTMTLAQTAALYAWHSRHHVAHIANLRTREQW